MMCYNITRVHIYVYILASLQSNGSAVYAFHKVPAGTYLTEYNIAQSVQ